MFFVFFGCIAFLVVLCIVLAVFSALFGWRRRRWGYPGYYSDHPRPFFPWLFVGERFPRRRWFLERDRFFDRRAELERHEHFEHRDHFHHDRPGGFGGGHSGGHHHGGHHR